MQKVLEFCAAAEAVVLNDVIYTLPSREPQDISSLRLLNTLRKENICITIEDVELTQTSLEAAYKLIGRLGNDRIYDDVLLGGDLRYSQDPDKTYDRMEHILPLL